MHNSNSETFNIECSSEENDTVKISVNAYIHAFESNQSFQNTVNKLGKIGRLYLMNRKRKYFVALKHIAILKPTLLILAPSATPPTSATTPTPVIDIVVWKKPDMETDDR